MEGKVKKIGAGVMTGDIEEPLLARDFIQIMWAADVTS